MRGGAWAHRRSYISRWIYQITTLAERTKEMSKQRPNEDAYVSALNEGDELGSVMEAAGATMPSMRAIGDDLRNLVSHADSTSEQKPMEESDLDDLLDERTPVLPNQEFPRPVSNIPKIDVSSNDEANEENYAESFASQRETSQLREELEAMSEEMRELKSTLAGVLKEREAIPAHMSAIREDINRQMTLMLDKLHSVSESDVSSSGVNAAVATLNAARDASSERLLAAADYASDRPRQSSPLATAGAELKGKRRFRPCK